MAIGYSMVYDSCISRRFIDCLDFPEERFSGVRGAGVSAFYVGVAVAAIGAVLLLASEARYLGG